MEGAQLSFGNESMNKEIIFEPDITIKQEPCESWMKEEKTDLIHSSVGNEETLNERKVVIEELEKIEGVQAGIEQKLYQSELSTVKQEKQHDIKPLLRNEPNCEQFLIVPDLAIEAEAYKIGIQAVKQEKIDVYSPTEINQTFEQLLSVPDNVKKQEPCEGGVVVAESKDNEAGDSESYLDSDKLSTFDDGRRTQSYEDSDDDETDIQTPPCKRMTFTQRCKQLLADEAGAGERYYCTKCGKRFSHLNFLNSHLYRAHKTRPYSCSLCDKTFVQSLHFKIHQRKHTGEKPFPCKTCGKTFAWPRYLAMHLRTHW